MKTKRLGAALAMVMVLLMAAAAHGAVQIEYGLDGSSIIGANPLSGVPEYVWWYGCCPTAGGMMVGYWDSQPGYENLFEGDASYWWGNTSPPITGTRSMVAGTAHVVAGMENGYTYGDWHNSPSYPAHEANPDSLADFMHTVDGGTYPYWIAKGLEDYVEWDNPSTATDESGPGSGLHFDAAVELDNITSYGGFFDYNDFKAEIDAGRPVLLNLTTFYSGIWNHSVLAYGYQDDMFTLAWPLGTSAPTVTVGGYAVMDTWDNGTAQSEWVGPGPTYATVYPAIDTNGVEWWPFLGFAGASFLGSWDWMVYQGIAMDIAIVPEPASMVIWLLLGGVCVLAGWQRRRKAA